MDACHPEEIHETTTSEEVIEPTLSAFGWVSSRIKFDPRFCNVNPHPLGMAYRDVEVNQGISKAKNTKYLRFRNLVYMSIIRADALF